MSRAQGGEDPPWSITHNIDAVQREPRLVERRREPRRVLKRERSERLPVPTSPRLLVRVVEREQAIESRGAAVVITLVLGTTLDASHHWTRYHFISMNISDAVESPSPIFTATTS